LFLSSYHAVDIINFIDFSSCLRFFQRPFWPRLVFFFFAFWLRRSASREPPTSPLFSGFGSIQLDLTSTINRPDTGAARPFTPLVSLTFSLCRRFRRSLFRSALRFASGVAPMIIFFSQPRLSLPDRLFFSSFGLLPLLCFHLHLPGMYEINRHPFTCTLSAFCQSRRSFLCACRGCRAARHRSFVIKRRGLHAP